MSGYLVDAGRTINGRFINHTLNDEQQEAERKTQSLKHLLNDETRIEPKLLGRAGRGMAISIPKRGYGCRRCL